MAIPGVPALAIPSSVAAVAFLALDAIALLFPSSVDIWGIFLDGEEAIPLNSVVRFDYRQDATVSDYQIEGGSFQSYNKTQLPFDVRLRITSGGTIADRQQMIAALEEMYASVDLYAVVTPEKTYDSLNCIHFDYNRQAMTGLGMLIIDVWFEEIRQTGTSTFSNTQSPTAAAGQNNGTVQPQTPATNFAPNFSLSTVM
jgi:hypothetical protein